MRDKIKLQEDNVEYTLLEECTYAYTALVDNGLIITIPVGTPVEIIKAEKEPVVDFEPIKKDFQA